MGVNSLPKSVTRQRHDCDLNPGPSAPESSTLATRLPSHPLTTTTYFKRLNLSWQFVSHPNLLLLFCEHGSFWNRNISEVSVATCARFGRISSKTLLAYLLENLPINNFKKIRYDLTELLP